MCFRQKNILNGVTEDKYLHRQWTNGKHSNQDCARAFPIVPIVIGIGRGNTLKNGLAKS